MQEFTLGFYDGITGLVIHPYMGAKRDGTVGFFKGVIRGFGGLFFKTQAGTSAPILLPQPCSFLSLE